MEDTQETMAKHEEWVPYTWYCSNCGEKVSGLKNADGVIKAQCSRCRTVMVRRLKGRRHDTIDLYAPKGQERYNGIGA